MVLCVASIIKVSNVATGQEQAVTNDLDAKVSCCIIIFQFDFVFNINSKVLELVSKFCFVALHPSQ